MRVLDLPEGEFFRQGDLALAFGWSRPPWVDELYGEVVWGTKGLRYRFRDVPTLMAVHPDAGWVTMTRGDENVGAYCIVPRLRLWNGESLPAVYRSFLAIRPGWTGQALGRTLASETRRFVDAHLERGVIFGHVERDNLASLAIARGAGYESIAELAVDNFSVVRPRAIDGVRRLRPGEREELVARLAQLYAGHQLADFADSVHPEYCWVLERGGEWLAAVQAEPRHFELTDLGFGGWLEWALPYLPVLRKLVDPEDYRFLWLQHIWFAEGDAAASYGLLEGVLNATNHRLANLQSDKASSVYRTWRRAGRLGPLALFGHRSYIMAGLRNVAPPDGPCAYTAAGT